MKLSSMLIIAGSVLLAIPAGSQGLGDLAGAARGGGGQDEKKDDKKNDFNVYVKLPPYFGPKKRIAVQDMELKITATTTTDPTVSGGSTTTQSISIPPPPDFGTGLTDMLTTALVNTGRFIVLERSDKGLADIQKEQALAGVADETKAQGNKLMGAQVLVRGAITEFTFNKSSSGGGGDFLRGLGIATAKSEAAIVIDVKLYDATTGEIIDSKQAEGKAKSSATSFSIDKDNLKFGGVDFKQSPLGAATREAIEKAIIYICQAMDQHPWEGRVADVVDDEGKGVELYLNVGKKGGIKVGDEFEVFHQGRVIMDPDTPGRVLSRSKGKRVGRCQVISVEDDIAIAKPTEGEGFAAKDVIRLIEKDKPAG